MMILNAHRSDNRKPYLFRVEATRPLALLGSCPAYAPTPLRKLDGLAGSLGLAKLWVKDETKRMRLGSFKALGGAYAVAQMISDAAGGGDPMSPEAAALARDMTFITASAGNHGLSVAAGAKVFGAQAVIVLAETVPEGFADRIRGLGARVLRSEGNYEQSIVTAKAEAAANGWTHLADGSWEGYLDAPALVMEGYTVLAEECRAEFAASGEWPTHVFLQAGVGGLAGAVAAHIRAFWDEQPEVVIVEPDAAACLLRSAEAGKLTHADGPESNMGRLDCKDASLIAFEALRQDADVFVTVTDQEATAAASELSGAGIATTPSGGASVAAIRNLSPGPDARVMMIASEGPERT